MRTVVELPLQGGCAVLGRLGAVALLPVHLGCYEQRLRVVPLHHRTCDADALHRSEERRPRGSGPVH